MNIIYSGFDTIDFAVRGALSGQAVERMATYKKLAETEKRDVPYIIDGFATPTMISANGRLGGYAFKLNSGTLGSMIVLKKNLSRNEWNGFVNIGSLALAVHGWEKAIKLALSLLRKLDFYVAGISMNRVDYCMDFLNPALLLDPKNFITHSRVTKLSYLKPEPSAVEYREQETSKPASPSPAPTCERKLAVSRGDTCESVTLGKMPGRQVIAYDKLKEVIKKQKYEWFEIWGLDPKDRAQSVLRVELRAGKKELQKFGIRLLKDFEKSIGDVFGEAVTAIRCIDPKVNETNISRQLLHSLWLHVQRHVQGDLLALTSYVEPSRVLHVIRKQKITGIWESDHRLKRGSCCVRRCRA